MNRPRWNVLKLRKVMILFVALQVCSVVLFAVRISRMVVMFIVAIEAVGLSFGTTRLLHSWFARRC